MPIAKGDLLLVIQMQGADINYTNTDSYGDGVAGGLATGNLSSAFVAGQYEYVVADNNVPVGGGSLTIAAGLKNGYHCWATALSGSAHSAVPEPDHQRHGVANSLER
jgi:hypothetical protein